MPVVTLSVGAVQNIERAVDQLFDRIKGRALGPEFFPYYGDKKIFVNFKPAYTIPGIYREAAMAEDVLPNQRIIHSLAKVCGGFLDAERSRVKSRVIHAVNAWLMGNPKASAEKVLAGELAPVWKETLDAVFKIVDTEGTTARNMGTLQGISEIAAARGIEDPNVFFIVVRDRHLCAECKRLHLSDNKITPRVYKMSELSGGYHDRGDNSPCVGGLHPHCRCTLVNLAPGYGFGGDGMIKFIGVGHDEYAAQRG